MTREELTPVAALVVLAGQKGQDLIKKSSGEEQNELFEANQALNYAGHVLADLMPERRANGTEVQSGRR